MTQKTIKKIEETIEEIKSSDNKIDECINLLTDNLVNKLIICANCPNCFRKIYGAEMFYCGIFKKECISIDFCEKRDDKKQK